MKNFFLVFTLFVISFTNATEKIRLYSIYTPSHEKLLNEWFLPSIQDTFELIIYRHAQECPTAGFMTSGWTKTTIRKVELWIKAAEENDGKIFICSDVDIQFLRPIEEHIRHALIDCDLVVQRNNPRGDLCSGFFACIGSQKIVNLFKNMLDMMQRDVRVSDQTALNHLLNISNPFDVTWRYLPVQFYGGGTLTGDGWKPGFHLPIPENILMHHANYTYGINHKIAQLKYVKERAHSGSNS